MKHILSIITFLFVLLNSSVSWGSVDGKGIECKKNDKENIVRYSFSDKKVRKYGYRTIEDKVQLIISSTNSYYLFRNYIDWTSYTFGHSLNRKTLKLTITDSNGNLRDTYHCEVYSNDIILRNSIEMMKRYQSEYDKDTKDNKI